MSKLGFEELPPETATAVTAARAAISRPLTIGDLAEASDKIDSAAVEAALMGEWFYLRLERQDARSTRQCRYPP